MPPHNFCNILLIFQPFIKTPLYLSDNITVKNPGGFIVAKTVSAARYDMICCSLRKSTQRSTKPTVIPMASGSKLILKVRMLNIARATNLLILSNNVAVNPGPFAPRNQVNNISVFDQSKWLCWSTTGPNVVFQ